MIELVLNNRLELHEKLVNILGSPNVYFQPPSAQRLSFPYFRYEREIRSQTADNINYHTPFIYTVTYVTKDVDDIMMIVVLEEFPTARPIRQYLADGLYHHVFSIY